MLHLKKHFFVSRVSRLFEDSDRQRFVFVSSALELRHAALVMTAQSGVATAQRKRTDLRCKYVTVRCAFFFLAVFRDKCVTNEEEAS